MNTSIDWFSNNRVNGIIWNHAIFPCPVFWPRYFGIGLDDFDYLVAKNNPNGHFGFVFNLLICNFFNGGEAQNFLVRNSAFDRFLGAVLTQEILFPAQISALIRNSIVGVQGIGLVIKNRYNVFLFNFLGIYSSMRSVMGVRPRKGPCCSSSLRECSWFRSWDLKLGIPRKWRPREPSRSKKSRGWEIFASFKKRGVEGFGRW